MSLIPLQRSEECQGWGLVGDIAMRPEDTSLPTRIFVPNISRVLRNPYRRTCSLPVHFPPVPRLQSVRTKHSSVTKPTSMVST